MFLVMLAIWNELGEITKAIKNLKDNNNGKQKI